MPYFTTPDDCNLFYRTYKIDPSKPAVVFLNGTSQTTLYWANLVPVFSKNFGLLFYDARGQGDSDLGTAPISLNLHVSDLKDLLDYLAVGTARLVGLSHGARVALEFAIQFPASSNRLVLCSISGRTSDRCRAIVRSWVEILKLSGLKAMAWAAVPTIFGNQFLKDHQNTIDMIVEAVVVRNSRQALIAQLEAILKYPAPIRLPAGFDIPTLILSGAQDPMVEAVDVRRLALDCRANHEHLAGIVHSIPAEAPEIFKKLVLEFFVSGE